MAFSFFFRDQQLLEKVADHCLPRLAGRNHPRIWDAGVAEGQEPYTVSILFAERMGHFAFNNLRIEATDVESEYAKAVEEGVYPLEQLSRLPDGVFENYFKHHDDAGRFRVVDSIRRRIVYRHHDLLSFREIGCGFSLVLCKNVLLHFKPEERVKVLQMFYRALEPGGFLVIEQTQQMPAEVRSMFERVTPGDSLFRKLENGYSDA